jgi:hypothetical protein
MNEVIDGTRFETEFTAGAIERARPESPAVLQECADRGLELSLPMTVRTSFGLRIMREIKASETFWKIWRDSSENCRRVGICPTKEEGKWVIRLWNSTGKRQARPSSRYEAAVEKQQRKAELARQQRQRREQQPQEIVIEVQGNLLRPSIWRRTA